MRLKNEPENIHYLHPHDQITWWIGAIAREAAQVELTCNLILRAILQTDEAALSKIYKHDRDLLLTQAITEIKKALVIPTIRTANPKLSSKIVEWLEGLNTQERNRVIHDVVAASSDGHTAFNSGQALTHGHTRKITKSYLNQIFTELQQAWQTGTELWTDADREWRGSTYADN